MPCRDPFSQNLPGELIYVHVLTLPFPSGKVRTKRDSLENDVKIFARFDEPFVFYDIGVL
jgi:hypothetical protein